MQIFMLDVVLVRVIMPIIGVGFFCWGLVSGEVGFIITGALALATSIGFWRLPRD